MKLQMPQKCPYCGKDFSFSRTSHFAKNKNGAIYFRIDELLCNHCGEISIAVSDKVDNPNVFVNFYPNQTKSPLFKEIDEFSPETANVYMQVLSARNNGLTRLMGIGLRIALETLVTDYLLKIKKMFESEVSKLTRSKRIALLENWYYLVDYANIARKFGNDEIHFFKNTHIDFEEAHDAFIKVCVGIMFLLLHDKEQKIETPPHIDFN